MKIGICDDEPHVCKQMQAEVNHYYHSLDILPVTFSHAEQLIEALRKDPDNFLCILWILSWRTGWNHRLPPDTGHEPEYPPSSFLPATANLPRKATKYPLSAS